MTTKGCASRFCKDWVTGEKVFCDKCWDKIPRELQERVADSFKAPEHDHRQPNPAFAVAVTQAASYLNHQGL
jgi:hypothetical protein